MRKRKPTKAAEAFAAASCGVNVADLGTLETDKGAWLVFRQTQAGQATPELLPAIVEKPWRVCRFPNVCVGARVQRSLYVRCIGLSCWQIMPKLMQKFWALKPGVNRAGIVSCADAITLNSPSDYAIQLGSASVGKQV